MSFDCLGSTLIKRTRNTLMPKGPGQGYTRLSKDSFVCYTPSAISAISDPLSPEVRPAAVTDKFEAAKAAAAIFRNTAHRGSGYGMPDAVGAAVPSRASLKLLDGGLGLDMTEIQIAGMERLRAGLFGPAPLGVPDKSARYRAWYNRAYGPMPLPTLGGPPRYREGRYMTPFQAQNPFRFGKAGPGLGIDFSNLLSIGSGFAEGGAAGAAKAYADKRAADQAKKAAERAAATERKTAKLQLEAAQTEAESRAKTTRMLLIGGGVAAAIAVGYLALRKKG